MATDTDIPVAITDEARAWIAQLGMQREFEQMLDHTKQCVSGLQAIEVFLDPDLSGQIGPGIIIFSYRDHPGGEDDPTDRAWGQWKIGTFPPEVWTNFVMMSIYGTPNHGR